MSHAQPNTQTDALPSREPAIPATRGAITLDRLPLDSGVLAPGVLVYEAWGALAPTRDNVIPLCHALTGNAHAHDPAAAFSAQAGGGVSSCPRPFPFR